MKTFNILILVLMATISLNIVGFNQAEAANLGKIILCESAISKGYSQNAISGLGCANLKEEEKMCSVWLW